MDSKVNTLSLQNLLDMGTMMLILNLDLSYNSAKYHEILVFGII